jgi:hypothetical protein
MRCLTGKTDISQCKTVISQSKTDISQGEGCEARPRSASSSLFDTVYLLLSYSGNPGVNGLSHRGGCPHTQCCQQRGVYTYVYTLCIYIPLQGWLPPHSAAVPPLRAALPRLGERLRPWQVCNILTLTIGTRPPYLQVDILHESFVSPPYFARVTPPRHPTSDSRQHAPHKTYRG